MNSNTETNSSTTSITPADAIKAIRELRAQIPNAEPIPNATAQRLRSAASVHPDFAQATVNAVGASEAVQAALGRSADELQLQLNEDGPWSALEDEARALLRGIAAANLARRHRIGLTALQTYSISRALARQQEHAALFTHVAEMKRLAKLRHGGRKQPQPAPQQGQ
jgi:hypothetical protein